MKKFKRVVRKVIPLDAYRWFGGSEPFGLVEDRGDYGVIDTVDGEKIVHHGDWILVDVVQMPDVISDNDLNVFFNEV